MFPIHAAGGFQDPHPQPFRQAPRVPDGPTCTTPSEVQGNHQTMACCPPTFCWVSGQQLHSALCCDRKKGVGGRIITVIVKPIQLLCGGTKPTPYTSTCSLPGRFTYPWFFFPCYQFSISPLLLPCRMNNTFLSSQTGSCRDISKPPVPAYLSNWVILLI